MCQLFNTVNDLLSVRVKPAKISKSTNLLHGLDWLDGDSNSFFYDLETALGRYFSEEEILSCHTVEDVLRLGRRVT